MGEIRQLSGDDLGVARDGNHLVVEWVEGESRVVFSYSRRGNAMSAHFACGKDSLRDLKQAIEDFCFWVLYWYDWCKMIFAFIEKPSVERLVKKCGFEHLADADKGAVYVRHI